MRDAAHEAQPTPLYQGHHILQELKIPSYLQMLQIQAEHIARVQLGSEKFIISDHCWYQNLFN